MVNDMARALYPLEKDPESLNLRELDYDSKADDDKES
jgi:hypothetical protein